ncbi:MAG: AAA family ATPase [Pseudomonadota bacterium]|nr:AAA family ATPase [Pseudomonadota bacterium]
MAKLVGRFLLLYAVVALGEWQLHANVNLESTVRTAIRQAIEKADAVAITAIFKQHNLTITSALNPNGETILHMLAIGANENIELFDALIADGGDEQIDLNVADNQGMTPLHNAALTDKSNLAGKLLAGGATPDVADNQGKTARQLAEEGGYEQVVEVIDESIAAAGAAEDEPLGVGAANSDEVDLSLILINMITLAQHKSFDPLIGRAPEITRIFEILGRRKKNNPVLVGLAGTGKTAIVEGVANLIANGNAPDDVKDKTLYSLNVSALLAVGGDLPLYLQALLDFAKQNPGTMFFADEVHALTRNVGGIVPIDMLKPALAEGSLRLIGATTEDEYRQHIAGDMTLARRMMRVNIDEPSLSLAALIAMSARDLISQHHGIKITNTAVYSAVTLSAQYLSDRTLPDKAIDLLDEAASAVRQGLSMRELQRQDLETQLAAAQVTKHIGTYSSDTKEQIKQLRADLKKFNKTSPASVVNTHTIGELIAKKTGIPVEKILQDRHEKVLSLLANLKKKVFGQDQALETIHEVLLASHAGLTDENKPLGSFMLRGPTGTGKTETGKRVAEILFDDESNLITIDMSEYSEQHAVAKLIGSPPGYVGYEDGGILTSAVMNRPYSVILFDEVEKAHRNFTHIMLQILDEGRLTDSRGHIVDFSNTVIMMTTNSTSIEDDFRPEVLGRIDEILTYEKLNRSVMDKLVLKNLEQINQRLFSKGITVSLDEQTILTLSKEGYSPKYGARPLETVFHRKISVPLSRMIVEGELEKNKRYRLSLDEQGELRATHITSKE